MQDSFDSEPKIMLGQAARLFARNGRPASATSVWRWSNKGVRGVRLEAAFVGGRLVTSAEAVQRFLDALNADRQPVVALRLVRHRRRAAEDAGRMLAELGA